jgi:hypothetical protein
MRMEVFFIYVFMGSLAAYALYLIFRGRNQAIADPTLGFLNLGDEFASLIAEDRAALSPLFSKVETGTGHLTPKCDVLFVYANIASDGSLGVGKELTIRHLAERAGASIVVLASNNPAEVGITAAKLPGPKRANVVWTLNRRGDSFPRFFKELFTRMKAGKSMPMAWVAISPQYKSETHRDLPETICQMEAGQVRFR